MQSGPQDNPESEAKRQFYIGYAAGVLGLERFSVILKMLRSGDV